MTTSWPVGKPGGNWRGNHSRPTTSTAIRVTAFRAPDGARRSGLVTRKSELGRERRQAGLVFCHIDSRNIFLGSLDLRGSLPASSRRESNKNPDVALAV